MDILLTRQAILPPKAVSLLRGPENQDIISMLNIGILICFDLSTGMVMETARDQDGNPGHWARRFQQIAVAVFQSEMEAIGCDLTPVQYAALVAIAEQSGMDQSTLAGEIAFDRTTITGVVDRLEAKGLITREISRRDRRARQLAITPAGRHVLERSAPAVAAAQDLMTCGLDSSERQTLVQLLRKAVEAANDLSRAPRRV